jgi:5-methyltetrahydropteroyltriglutamate--homocysteine methyltransferase
MTDTLKHPISADVSFDGGDLDCGNGLLLLIRKHIDPLEPGSLLEILSTEISVDEDLPAWCRMTNNELVSFLKHGQQRSFLVAKGQLAQRQVTRDKSSSKLTIVAVSPMTQFPAAIAAPDIAPMSVMGIGSWPRPRWMLQAVHQHLEGRLSDDEFEATANDAVRLAMSAQLRAGASVMTDGEQRRDSYASFVAARLDNCQLIPLTDLLPLVDNAEEFERELRALDVPATDVRHPAVFGPLGRGRGIAVHEAQFARTITELPIKIALPGPYLLTRTMWMECLVDRSYANREDLANDIVRVLREEIACLLAAGVALIQLDEPVLSEVVFSGPSNQRSFMCGALSAKREPVAELAFARDLINAVTAGFPRGRLAVHMCRGNWTPDETKALAGDYRPLLPILSELKVGTLFLELHTPRAGEMQLLRTLPDDIRVGIGACNQKHAKVETVESVVTHIEQAIQVFGAERLLLTPDCGFATFADNPLTSATVAESKLSVLVAAAQRIRQRTG